MQYSQVRVSAEKMFTEDLSNLFNAELVQSIIRESKVESLDNVYHALLQGHSFKVTKELTPGLHSICRDVQKTLGFEESIEFFIESSPTFNAYAISRIEEDQPHLITINSGIIDKFSHDELRFIVGHEIGHLISQNSELRRVIGFVYPPKTEMSLFLSDKLDTWDKLSELTADRFGYIAIPDLAICRSVFFKLSSGLDTDKVEFNGDAYQESMDDILEFFKNSTGALSTTHPVNPIRLKALQHFSESMTYEAVKADKDIKDDEVLTEQMAGLTQLILNKGGSPLSWARNRFYASAGLLVANIDGQETDDEIKMILSALASATHFPRELLDEIVAEGDIMKTFSESLGTVLEANPSERPQLFLYMVEFAMRDRKLAAQEVDLLFKFGVDVFGFQRKEVAQIIAEILQKNFIPDLLG